MKKIIYTGLVCVMLVTACSKKGEECPLQQYHIQCEFSEPDIEFGGYLTGTSDYYYETNCPSDAQAYAKNTSYDWGNTYKNCKIIP